MREIDNYTDEQLNELDVKGMTAPRTASERPPFHPRLDVALAKMRCNIVPELSVCVIAEAYDALAVKAAHADKLAEALREALEWCEEEVSPNCPTEAELTVMRPNRVNVLRKALAAYEAAQ